MREKKFNKCLYWIIFSFIIFVTAFFCFYKLDVKYVDKWDEARHGINAYEMLHTGNLIENTYLYKKDLYNLKPPLSMWCILLSFRIFGETVFALRFYSAICYLILVVIVGLFTKRYGILSSLFAMGFLAINSIAYQSHMIRSGDADSLYVLLFTLAMLFMIDIPKSPKNIYYSIFCSGLAFLTKSYHAGVIVVIIAIFLIVTSEWKKINLKKLFICFIFFITPLLIWAIPRYFNDGLLFFKQMLYTDVFQRSKSNFDTDIYPFFWYLKYLLGAGFGKIMIYLWAFIICIIGCFLVDNLFSVNNFKKIVGFILWIIVPFFSYSLISSKRIWYMYPVLIPLLMLAGIILGKIVANSHFQLQLRTLATLMGILLIIYYAKETYTIINSQKSDGLQQFIAQVSNQMQETNIYIVYGEEDVTDIWSQQDVFIAEISGDSICKEGGLSGFFNDNSNCIVVMSKNYYRTILNITPKSRILSITDEYVALLK